MVTIMSREDGISCAVDMGLSVCIDALGSEYDIQDILGDMDGGYEEKETWECRCVCAYVWRMARQNENSLAEMTEDRQGKTRCVKNKNEKKKNKI